MRSTSLWFGLLGGALLLACGDDGGPVGGGQMLTTRSSVSDGYAAAGDVIVAAGAGVSGIYPGTGPDDIRDGWTVEYQKLLVTLGTVTLRDTSDGDIEVPSDVVVDLQGLPDGGSIVSPAGVRYGPSSIEFSMPQADPARFSPLTPATAEQDAELMAKGGYAVYVEGTIEKKDGQSCPPGAPITCVPAPRIRFRWGLPHGVFYSDCAGSHAAAEDPVVLTFPAVRWLYTEFAAGSAAPPLRAQWIADADLDHDGETTVEELQKVEAAALFTPERGYDLSGASTTITSAYDFLREQVRSLGRNSWGVCASVRDL